MGKFSNIYKLLQSHGIKNESVDGMLLDIGASSIQFDDPDRGFSFYKDGPLDMRMDVRNFSKERGDKQLLMTAADVVNSINETELTAVLRQYGQEKDAGWCSICSLLRHHYILEYYHDHLISLLTD